jgi:hypothetical protein
LLVEIYQNGNFTFSDWFRIYYNNRGQFNWSHVYNRTVNISWSSLRNIKLENMKITEYFDFTVQHKYLLDNVVCLQIISNLELKTITNEVALIKLLNSCSNLIRLEFIGFSFLSDNVAVNINNLILNNLIQLNLSFFDRRFHIEGFSWFVQKCRNLKYLSIGRTYNTDSIPDSAICELIKNNPRLEDIDLMMICGESILDTVKNSCLNLKQFQLEYLKDENAAFETSKFVTHFKNLEFANFQDTAQLEFSFYYKNEKRIVCIQSSYVCQLVPIFRNLINLNSITIDSIVTPDILSLIITNNKHLSSLKLSCGNGSDFTSVLTQILITLKELKYLSLGIKITPLTNETAMLIFKEPKHNLTELHLPNSVDIKDELVHFILKQCPNLIKFTCANVNIIV